MVRRSSLMRWQGPSAAQRTAGLQGLDDGGEAARALAAAEAQQAQQVGEALDLGEFARQPRRIGCMLAEGDHGGRHPLRSAQPVQIGERAAHLGCRVPWRCSDLDAAVDDRRRQRLENRLDEGLGAAHLGDDGADAGDDLWPVAPVNCAHMAEESFEFLLVELFGCRVPGRDGPIGRLRRHLVEDLGFEDVVTCQRFAAPVEHQEHAVRTIDVARQHDDEEARVLM